ncbi:MAG: hypothetical protein ACREQL_09395 [Candidatus Binatia bacterium]
MPLLSYPPSFARRYQTTDGQPSPNEGETVASTTTSGLYGAYNEAFDGALLTQDVYGIHLQFNDANTSTASRPGMVAIGVDPTAGTAYTTVITDLLSGTPGQLSGLSGAGTSYYFPFYIKAGSSVAVKFATLGITTRALSYIVRLDQAPRYMDALPVGQHVYTYGVGSLGLCQGVAMDANMGTVSEGVWTEIGTVAAGTYPWWWQVGVSVNNAATTSLLYTVDLAIGDASNKHIVFEEMIVQQGTNETTSFINPFTGVAWPAAPGDKVYARIQCSGTADTGVSIAAYGMA